MYALWRIMPDTIIQQFHNPPVEFAGRVPATASTGISLTDEHFRLCRTYYTLVDHSGRAAFACLSAGILGSNSTRGMDVCVRLFCVSVVLRVVREALQRADPPSKESYRLCIGSRN
jgi:hypothetical protein